MARPGHASNHRLLDIDEDEDPLDAMIARTGCVAQHRELQQCMAIWQDWRECQPQVQAFADCMTGQQRSREP
ncbi:COA4 factor, partial [Jacana jacana]|nr:COA4 factor [Jacana jacana]